MPCKCEEVQTIHQDNAGRTFVRCEGCHERTPPCSHEFVDDGSGHETRERGEPICWKCEGGR
jgi:hypothetical protein